MRFMSFGILCVAATLLTSTRVAAKDVLDAHTAWQIIEGCIAQSKDKRQSHAIAV